MPTLRHPRKKEKTAAELIAELRDSLQRCQDKITQLEHENDSHTKRMAAMQAAIDHLAARFGRS